MSIHDLSAFSHSITKEGTSWLSRLNTSIPRVRACGSFAFLEEMFALKQNKKLLYRNILDEYLKATYKRIVLLGMK